MAGDPRLDAARYTRERLDRAARAEAEQAGSVERAGRAGGPGRPADDAPEPDSEAPPQPSAEQRAAYIETSIQQAMRRGDFDDLPGAGKPLTGLRDTHDPDWWIRGKIRSENLTGLGPPALTLRTEDAALDTRLDALHREEDVRAKLEDFNSRVIDARRQLQGGPPVVTPTRDVDAGIAAWRERRQAAAREASARREREQAEIAALSWRERRRARRRGQGRA